MTSIQIHEFSTGIRPQIAADGSWVSLGFTGQYMNATIDPIPRAVQRSIANKEFAIAEGASSDEPAVIGRVVQDSEESDWSVVAVVTRGQDEKGRSASFYRYFLCEGRDSLWKILAWMEEYERNNGHKPIFNPSETKELGQPYPFQISTALTNPLKNSTELLENSTSIPIIIPPDRQYTLEEINALATAKADGQPISWAFNAEALEKPWSFIVIQAASDRAFQLLHRAIANTPKVQTPVVADEQALKSAIKSLIGSSNVKPEAVQAIADALENDQITKDYWHTLFDSQGARNALSQKIYSPQMIRLLTLRALVIPDTLPQYLDWLSLNENLNKRSSNPTINSALEFQSNLRPLLNEFPQIKKNLTDGLKVLTKHHPPATLFEQLGDYALKYISDSQLSVFYYQIAAYFEQNIKGRVSQDLFIKAFPNNNSYAKEIWGRQVIKERSRIFQEESDIVPLPLVILIAICCLCLGGLGGFIIGKSGDSKAVSNSPEIANTTENRPINSVSPQGNNAPNASSSSQDSNASSIPTIPKEKRGEALENFDSQTRKALQKVVSDIENNQKEKNSSTTREEIVESLKITLKNQDLNYELIEGKLKGSKEELNTAKNQWIDAIYSYQSQKGLPDKGFILVEAQTINSLKQDVESNLKNIPPYSPPSGS